MCDKKISHKVAVCYTDCGPVLISVDEDAVCSLRFIREGEPSETRGHSETGRVPLLDEACRQVQQYFSGTRKRFELPLRLDGTSFQRAVWQATTDVAFGSVVTYGELAVRLGKPQSARAVGQALGRNPIPIIVPCHRVVSSAGTIGGFSPDISLKKCLLTHEGVAM